MRIKASLCKNCNEVTVPPRETCPYCGTAAESMESIVLDSKGVVTSHTRLHTPPQGFSTPVDLSLVQLERGAIILCLAESDEEVHIGSSVEITLDGENRFRYRIPD